MRIICKLEKRVLDADYLQVGEEGPRCGLFASWRRGPWCGLFASLRRGPWTGIICKLEKRALDADYLQVGEEGPGYGFCKLEKSALVRII